MKIICLNPECKEEIVFSDASHCPRCGTKILTLCPACRTNHYPTPICYKTGIDPNKTIEEQKAKFEAKCQLYTSLMEKWPKDKPRVRTFFSWLPGILTAVITLFCDLIGLLLDTDSRSRSSIFLIGMLIGVIISYLFTSGLEWYRQNRRLRAVGVQPRGEIANILDRGKPVDELSLDELNSFTDDIILPDARDLLLRPAEASPAETLLRPANTSEAISNDIAAAQIQSN